MEDSLKTILRLMLVDDDLSTLEVLGFQLSKQGYGIETFLDAEKALEALKEKEFDLVISDIAMPGMDGLVFLDNIKRLKPELPVIMLTGMGSVETAVEAMKRGAVDFIPKPASFGEISIRIERALEVLERKKAYQLLKDQVEELKRACESLEKTSDHNFQSEKLAAMGLIVSGIAHEINNPLTAVIGYSQLLMDTNGHDMGRQLKVVRDQAQRCAKIIQEMMFFARRRKPVFAEMDLRDTVLGALQESKIDFETRKVASFLFPPSGEIMISGDSGLLKKVFAQLFLNAAHALEETKENRRVEIRISDSGEFYQVEVQDNGPGIPAEHLPKIFDPFFSTKEVGRGAGLGLSLCYGVIADHGGRIKVRNEKGKGAHFSVFLPKKNSSANLPQ